MQIDKPVIEFEWNGSDKNSKCSCPSWLKEQRLYLKLNFKSNRLLKKYKARSNVESNDMMLSIKQHSSFQRFQNCTALDRVSRSKQQHAEISSNLWKSELFAVLLTILSLPLLILGKMMLQHLLYVSRWKVNAVQLPSICADSQSLLCRTDAYCVYLLTLGWN